ncbi:hypothetical protein NDU88_006881 [Pleurodeles waltl]|uniref:Uncharacterized protein n=1 Tax=Pleurodeles waltl TaxID=8319 RepID=A0AAV7RQ19_PLEWA|nr:hypothetical protein NDU88_006881 [Pleurodeles waltl]
MPGTGLHFPALPGPGHIKKLTCLSRDACCWFPVPGTGLHFPALPEARLHQDIDAPLARRVLLVSSAGDRTSLPGSPRAQLHQGTEAPPLRDADAHGTRPGQDGPVFTRHHPIKAGLGLISSQKDQATSRSCVLFIYWVVIYYPLVLWGKGRLLTCLCP